ncbi:hypothetical protein scyTo_0021176, partial [Scyliorhinus torazame]|nr:hypothetical protein [Scyliorhinus torazame]
GRGLESVLRGAVAGAEPGARDRRLKSIMRFYLLFPLLLSCGFAVGKFDDFEDADDIAEYDDNDFAEFEDASEDAPQETVQKVITVQDDEEEATVEVEDQDDNQEDFEDADAAGEGDAEGEPFDDEEFEGYEEVDRPSSRSKDPIKIVNVSNRRKRTTFYSRFSCR